MTADQVAIVGLWHLGSVVASGLAAYGIDTVGLDRDKTIVEGLNRAEPPLFEPGLADAVRNGMDSGSLRFDADPHSLADARFVWLTADSELDDSHVVDIQSLLSLVCWFAPHVRMDAILLISSQVPTGTTEILRDEMSRARPDWRPRVAYIPENLRLGSAIERFHHPDWLVVGADDATAGEVTRFLAPVQCKVTITTPRTAELAKHAINGYLATCISLANELGDLAEALGADGLMVAQIMHSDRRVAEQAPLRPGAGFSGGTLSREIQTLRDLGKRNDIATPLADAVASANQNRTAKILTELSARLDLSGAVVAILGVAYKPNSSSMRDSDSLRMISRLAKAGASVRVHDPFADVADIRLPHGARLVAAVGDAVSGASALVLMSEHDDYRNLDLPRLVASMAGRVVVDPHHLLTSAVDGLGADYVAFGRASTRGRQ
ncbi:nucleotide sugar dehydrogenase [Streptomyces sp. NPDC020747]|uniref:nucleotide sugar dehydrogenase n=1 Tax=Streptomyces sp. NPDC020747 TaxID=3365086 RepID=UPI0037A450A0